MVIAATGTTVLTGVRPYLRWKPTITIEMERLSSITVLDDGGAGLARSVSTSLGLRIGRFSGWVRDKGRQIRSLPGNEELIRAVLSSDRAPAEGARYRVGERINIYQPDGECWRFKIYGVQSGGFSNVYTVIDLDEMRPYCLKENRALPGDEKEKNQKLAVEAEISLKLSPDPNLVTAYAALFFRSRLMILTEYLSANTLDQQLKNGVLPLPTALSYGVQLSAAVHRAQSILPGFIHGDIKPGNCFITSKGQLKLGDFGLASAEGIGAHTTGSTDAAIGWGGTNAYMAPEMFDKIPDRSSADIYAFGVTLFEMLSGTRPFAASSKEKVIEMHRAAEPPLDSLAAKGVPGQIVDLVGRCMSKSPADRPGSFGSVERDLRQTLRDEFGISVPSDPVPELTDFEMASKAFSFAALGLGREATESADLAIRRYGPSPEMLACKAITLTLTDGIEEAYEASTSALMADARSFIVLLAHGQTLAARGDLGNAEDYLLRAIQLEPDNCIALNFLGGLYLRTEQYDQAAICFETSRKLDPSQPEAWEGLAIVNLFAGSPDEAIRLFQKVLSLDPRRGGSHSYLGDAYRAGGNLVEAIRSYKAALCMGSESERTAQKFVRSCIEFYRGKGHAVNGRLAAALIRGAGVFREVRGRSEDDFAKECVLVLEENDLDPLVVFFLDGALTRVADGLSRDSSQKLVQVLRNACPRSSSQTVPPYVLESLGRTFYYLSEYDDCRAVFRALADRIGPNERSFYYFAACSEVAGNYPESLENYRAALRFEDCEDTRTGIQRVTAKIRMDQKALTD